MVRHKTRWLLVQVDFARKEELPSISRKDIQHAIRDKVLQCGGDASRFFAIDIQARFYDEEIRVAMVRVPHGGYGPIRDAIKLVNTISASHQNHNISLSVLHVSGSARTAKIAALKIIRRMYRSRLLKQKKENNNESGEVDRLCQNLTKAMRTIQEIN